MQCKENRCLLNQVLTTALARSKIIPVIDNERMTLWKNFVDAYGVEANATYLFEELTPASVTTKRIGSRSLLQRSHEAEALISSICATLEDDWKSNARKYDGMLYIMLTKEEGHVIPLYIGKAETVGKQGNLSANIKGVSKNANKGKFARWGDGRQYHIGDLSAAVLRGYEAQSVDSKYKKWASALFESVPTGEPRLKHPVFLWAKAWGRTEVGVWPQFGPTRLTFQEYLLIGLCSSLFGNRLLNAEGQSR
jgi:hypothetical protein